MDRVQFLAWVNDPRTEAELTAQISLMGQTAPAAGSPLDDFRDVLRSHAAAQPAAWTVPAGQIPAGWTPPAAVPAAPTPVTPAGAPAPAATPPPPGRRGWINGGNAPFLIVGSVLILGAIALWVLFGSSDGWDKLTDDDGVQATTTSTATPVAGDGSTVLTENRVREIVDEETKKISDANPSMTQAQVQQLIDKAVSDAKAEMSKLGGLTEDQIRKIVADVKAAASAAATAPPPATTAQTGDSTICRGDKISTANEVNSAGPQRQELGGGGYQLVDFYPQRGIKAVSYIVPPLQKADKIYVGPAIGMGFGSIWEYNGPDCASYDFVPEVTNYSQGRLGNGHTGLTIDLRGTPKLVGNAGNMAQAAIEEVLRQDANAIKGWNLDPKAIASQVNSISSTRTTSGNGQAATSPSGDCKATQTSHTPTLGQAWVIPGSGPRIANVWSNATSDQQERKLKIAAGEKLSIPSGGGTVWEYPAGCESQVDKEFASNSLPSYR